MDGAQFLSVDKELQNIQPVLEQFSKYHIFSPILWSPSEGNCDGKNKLQKKK